MVPGLRVTERRARRRHQCGPAREVDAGDTPEVVRAAEALKSNDRVAAIRRRPNVHVYLFLVDVGPDRLDLVKLQAVGVVRDDRAPALHELGDQSIGVFARAAGAGLVATEDHVACGQAAHLFGVDGGGFAIAAGPCGSVGQQGVQYAAGSRFWRGQRDVNGLRRLGGCRGCDGSPGCVDNPARSGIPIQPARTG